MTEEEQEKAIKIYLMGYKEGHKQGVKDMFLNLWEEEDWNTAEYEKYYQKLLTNLKNLLRSAFKGEEMPGWLEYPQIVENLKTIWSETCSN